MKNVLLICPISFDVWHSFGTVPKNEKRLATLKAGDICLVLQNVNSLFNKNGAIVEVRDTQIMTPDGVVGWIGAVSEKFLWSV